MRLCPLFMNKRQKTKTNMGASNKTGKFAVGFTAFAFVFILIAFCSPYWLVTDGELDKPKFINLGK